ncbi:hypothetical protein HHI36_015117 [Cryptolaemus montrouzieri]|uniref:Uncharacterized protein n=1 Tax=Cryptolaemus montrouzieri TaxID=559131 RepID=A0ABD2N5H4_9CUCU
MYVQKLTKRMKHKEVITNFIRLEETVILKIFPMLSIKGRLRRYKTSNFTEQLATLTNYNTTASWFDEESEICQDYTNMEYTPLTTGEVINIIKKLHNWKAAGPYHVQNYWLKKLWCTHERLIVLINEALLSPEKCPCS